MKDLERCPDTIDLEECIEMKDKRYSQIGMIKPPANKKKEVTQIRATVTYNSGRTESFVGKLNAKKRPYKKFENKLAQYRGFPTVVNINVEMF